MFINPADIAQNYLLIMAMDCPCQTDNTSNALSYLLLNNPPSPPAHLPAFVFHSTIIAQQTQAYPSLTQIRWVG